MRRAILALAALGLDVRPLARRFRAAVLRQYRAETDERLAALAQRVAEGEARQDRLAAELATATGRAEAASRAAAERFAGVLATVHQQTGTHLEAVTQALQALQRDFTRAVTQTDARLAQAAGVLEQRVAAAAQAAEAGRAALADDLRQAAAERDALRARVLLLERLLCGGPAARPPGAAAAVAALPCPAVSVIMATRNRAAFVGEAIASVQAQSFRNWELVVVDDGSTDDTNAAVQPLLADPRIRMVRHPHAGAAAARNRGLTETTAPLVAYLDDDNLWHPGFLACAVDCLATDPDLDLAYGALATQDHGLDGQRILWRPFDRAALLAENFIDTSVLVHRRALVARHGGWDTQLGRLTDWDLVLRYTAEKPARQIDVIAAFYRRCDDARVTETVAAGPAEADIRRKWLRLPAAARRPRVLYAVWHYPQLSETYVETELRCARDWGAEVELWRTGPGASPYLTDVRVHEGTLADAVAATDPDIIHVHWLGFALSCAEALAASGRPVTLRLHGFDTEPQALRAWLEHEWVRAVFAFPGQLARSGVKDTRLHAMPAAFDSRLFRPGRQKDRRLVVRTAAALPGKDLGLFLQAAQQLPDFRFVLAAVTCRGREDYVNILRDLHAKMGNPAVLRFDMPRAEVAALLAEAALYVHTAHPPDAPDGTPIGQPVSIAEAMASGCHVLVRNLPPLAELVSSAGATYADLPGLVAQIRGTQDWTEASWQQMQRQAVRHAFLRHADVMALPPLFAVWRKLAAGDGA